MRLLLKLIRLIPEGVLLVPMLWFLVEGVAGFTWAVVAISTTFGKVWGLVFGAFCLSCVVAITYSDDDGYPVLRGGPHDGAEVINKRDV